MTRPRTLDAHPREFFAWTEDLLVTPARAVQCPGPGPRAAQALRAGLYHFWSRLRREIEDTGFRPPDLDALAERLRASGKLGDAADASLLRALYRVAANTSMSIDGQNILHFVSKSSTALASILADNLSAPPQPTADGGAGLLAELERAGARSTTKLD